ncbi:MAG: FAD-binding oxidoreductase [Desulfovibrionaceae bacterium]|nr:FAD-binding oxidoreductase [Desulfovibrionaceae bacterium]
MPHLGPHISISDEELLSRVFGLMDLAEYGRWPEEVRALAAGLAAELFLVRYNPFIDPELVRQSVSRRLNMARPTLSADFPKVLAAAVSGFWEAFEADQRFKAAVLERARAFLPESCISTAPNCLVESATDATDLRLELPMFVTFPETADQVRRLIALANELGFGIVPRGGGTGLTGGAIPLTGRCAVLSLARFKKILDIDPQAMTLTAQAGVITLDAIEAAESQGLLFTVDPASKAASTLGGNISENSGGPYAFEYGTTIDNILSYRMVTALGELIEVRRKDHPGHKIFPDQTVVFEVLDHKARLLETLRIEGRAVRAPGLGKDVSNKFLGGLPGVQKEGVDGVILDATFVLHGMPAHERTLCLEFFGRSMRNAMLVIKDVVALRDRIREHGDRVKISALEEFGPKYVQAIDYQKKSLRYEGDPISVLLLQLDSDDQEALDQAAETIVALASPFEGVDIFAARDEREAEIFWEDRHKLSAIAKRTSGFKINEDVVIPLEVIPRFSDFLEDLNLKYLAKAYRRALIRARELPGVDLEDAKIEAAVDRCRAVLKGRITARETSDQEMEAQVRYLFNELRDAYPKKDREIESIFNDLNAKRIVIANHMHAGDGNCHVNVPVNSNDPEMIAEAHQAVEEVFAEVLRLNGEVSGEHGIGITKIGFLSQDKIEALKKYKQKADPNGVLNPGKLMSRKLPAEPYTFSFNRLIQDLDKTALKDKEELIGLLRDIQTCTRCGKCKQACPMFYPQKGLLHHPRNKNISLGALIEAICYTQVQAGEPDRGLLAELREIMEHCTACGKCTAACPVKIDSAGAALRIRAFLEYKGQGGHPLKTALLKNLARDPAERLPKAAKVLSLGQSLGNRTLGLVPARWRGRIENPALAGPNPHLDYKNLYEELGLADQCVFKNPGAAAEDTALYFPGCGAALFSRSIAMAALYLLLKAGANVVLPPRHLCCGYPLLAAGCMEAFNTNRHRVTRDILDLLIATGRAGLKATVLLTACGTCREALEGFEFKRELAEPFRHLDAVQFLLERLKGPLPEAQDLIYHASCHAEWVGAPKAKAADMYRRGLEALSGAKAALSPGCCAESGLGALSSPDIYNRLRERKKEQLGRDLAGADKKTPLVVGCPSCKVGIKRSLMHMRRHNPVVHATEYLAQALGGPKWKRELKKALDSAEIKGRARILTGPVGPQP